MSSAATKSIRRPMNPGQVSPPPNAYITQNVSGPTLAVTDQPQVREMTELLGRAIDHNENLVAQLESKLSDLVVSCPQDNCKAVGEPARMLAPFAQTLCNLADTVARSNDRLRLLLEQVQF